MRRYIETKRGGVLDPDQIRRHLKSIAKKGEAGRGEGAILIGLTREPIADSERKSLISDAAGEGIAFAAVTFTQITERCYPSARISSASFCRLSKTMRAIWRRKDCLRSGNFPCGTSIAENARFGLYYEPSSRPSKRNYRFIGVCNMKTVACVGAVEAVAW